jgi:hypothetical protein
MIEEALVISGTPRSGTTWLLELLMGIPGSGALYEPLLMRKMPEAREAGLGYKTELARDESAPFAREFFSRVLNGEVRNDSLLRLMPRHFEEPGRWIVKLTHGNRLLAWLVEQFPIRKPILILRHPCAVIASMLPRRTPEQLERLEEDAFLERHPAYRPLWSALQSPEQKIAARWAIDQLVPLAEPRPYPFHTLFYEDLLTDGVAALQKIFDDWDLAMPEGLEARLDRPSITSSTKRPIPRSRAERLAQWRSTLDDRQVRDALDTVRTFGIDWYDEELRPHHGRFGEAQLHLLTE